MAPSMTKALPVCALMVLALSLPACGGSDSPSQPDDMMDDDPTAGTVAVVDNSFNPDAVSVDGGDTVTWTWEGSNEHNVTWTSADLANSSTQSSGSHSVTMPSESGGYDYYCTIHGSPNAGMRGTVNVE